MISEITQVWLNLGVQKRVYLIGVVVPCFNEEFRFNSVYWKSLIENTKQVGVVWLFLNDGSSDNTESILDTFCASQDVFFLSLKKNVGKGNAVRMGFLYLLDNFPDLKEISFLDADGAFASDEVVSILKDSVNKKIPDFDIFITSRVKLSGTDIQRSQSRHIISRLLYTIVARSWTWAPYDTQCGFKVFKVTDAFIKSLKDVFHTKWLFDIEIMTRLAIYLEQKPKIIEKPLSFWYEVGGGTMSWNSSLRILKESFFIRREILKMLKLLRKSRK